jgi:ribosomal protein S18 acetylase RimI-like enzyme
MKPSERVWSVQLAGHEDQDLVEGLLESASWQHRHLDWAHPGDLLGQAPYLLALDEGLPAACLAAPPDPEGVSWLRLFAVASGYELEAVWQDMWTRAAPAAAEAGAKLAAVLCLARWLPGLLAGSGFEQTDSVVFLEWAGQAPAERAGLEGLRPMVQADLEAVAELDHQAFDPIWRHSHTALELALRQASYATCLVRQGRMVAYQISTGSAFGGHLARLAVDPAWQGQGVAQDVVSDVLRHFATNRSPRVTVNTQASNQRSLRLYERLGFGRTEQVFPVFEKAL